MHLLIRAILLSTLLFMLSACGGGSSDSENSTTPLSSKDSSIISNSQNYSVQELKDASINLVNKRYTGNKNKADIDIELAQQVFLNLFGDSITEEPEIANKDFREHLDVNGNIDITFTCDYQGTVEYKGKLDANFKGNISLNYINCEQSDNDFAISGSAAISISELTDSSINITYYYDNLHWNVNGQSVQLSGYSNYISNENDTIGQFFDNNDQQILYTIDNKEQYFLNAQLDYSNQTNEYEANLSGELFIGDTGKVSLSLENVNDLPPYINSGKFILTGNNLAAFEFDRTYIRYVEDNNNDAIFDVGTFFSSRYELLNGVAASKQLVSLDILSLPPSSNSPRLVYGQTISTLTPIEISPGSYSDPDTDIDQLQISYRWYINDEIVSNNVSNILPAHLAVYGDSVKVTMLVSDGSNLIESRHLSINLEDSPAQVQVTNIPALIQSGDVIQFSAVVSDPDTGTKELNSVLISGPIGATIDDGIVTWTIPTDLLFPFQEYEFTFAILEENGDHSSEISIPVMVESDKKFPIARSGVEVPKNNKSMWVGDFDGDNKNEILSTDSIGSIFLLEYDSGTYQQKWVYPFKVPSKGQIKQVLAINIDNDAELEIIVVTEHGISLINGLNSLATLLFSSDNVLTFATVKDIDNDGTPELAYLSSSNSYSSSDISLNVISMGTPEQSLFSTNVSEAKQIEFANVDADSNLELITNNGLVYDTSTWQNQWFSGTEFGNASVTTGDYNGDGIAEIAGSNRWGNIAVYSATNKAQLDSLDNFNTCSLHSADVDNDTIDELLVGDCQWGNITAYKLINNKLTSLWSVDMQDHGSVSLTSGDSDNDGKIELHWGSGISHSGEDIFVSADLEGSTVSIKEEATSIQLGSYNSAGWSNIINDQERAVFFIPKTQSSYGGSRIATIDQQGHFELSDEISSNWDASSYAVTTDFNHDGFGDIFLPSTQTYDGSFSVMQLYNKVVHWQTTGSYSSNIGIIKAKDINADGFEDAIYADSKELHAIDVQNQIIISNYTFDSQITDFTPLRIQDKPGVIVALQNKLILLTSNNSVFSEQAFINQACNRLELINYDTDTDLELMCLQRNSNQQQLIIYKLNDLNFTEVARNDIDNIVLDIAIDPTTKQQQNVFLTVQTGTDSAWYDDNNSYQIKKSTANGNIIWSSPALVGKPSSHGLKTRYIEDKGLELMISTRNMMYWIK